MTAAVSSSTHPGRDDVFLSVFAPKNFTTPTPVATPSIGTLPSPVQSSSHSAPSFEAPDDAVKFSRAWSAATRYLALPPVVDPAPQQHLHRHAVEAFTTILPLPSSLRDLTAWYTNEINVHFRNFVQPVLQAWETPISASQADSVLQNTIQVLQKAQQQYLSRPETLATHFQHGRLADAAQEFQHQAMRNLHVIVLHSLGRKRVQPILARVMFQHLQSSLRRSSNEEKCVGDSRCHCKLGIDSLLLQQLRNIGLGGLIGEQALAYAIDKLLEGPVLDRRCFQVDWNGHSSVMSKLRMWVEQTLTPVIQQALSAIAGNVDLIANDTQQFVSMAVANLSRARTLYLFDYIKSWPASTGAILDIREFLSAGGQMDKAHVCQSFSNQVQKRLLHAGASTSEILSIYVNVIHAFKMLDSRGVLLEKVAVPIRRYLRGREDTVGIIAASFLADVDQNTGVSLSELDKICPDITIEVANSTLGNNRDTKTLNWDDMEWTPDPIDAGPDYKSSQSEDVIAYILGLFEQEEFIKEVTTVLAQHLLRASDAEFVKETRLVELFKSRLDASKLQAAEVMLKDVRDSVSLGKRINPYARYDSISPPPPTPREIQAAIPEEGITLSALYKMFEGRMRSAQFVAAVKLVANKRNELLYAKRTRLPPDPPSSADGKKESGVDFKAQILSSFFWPQLRSNEFHMPSALQMYSDEFEKRFNALGSQRRLRFRSALARVSLRLDLDDRIVEETDVPAWRASVIDLFASASAREYNGRTGLDVASIMEALEMEEELVQDAVGFWLNKTVLYEPSPGVYAVLERLDMHIAASTQTHTRQEEALSAVVSQDAMLREGAPMFQTFIANMLRNQGSKQIGGMMGITNLLKMVLPTFTYGDDEVAWLLSEMEGRGEVVRSADLWSIA